MSTDKKLAVWAVVATDHTYIPLSVIETMQCEDPADPEAATLNKLKDDLLITAVTFTGRQFTISMRYMRDRLDAVASKTVRELWIEIAQQWIEIINGKGKK